MELSMKDLRELLCPDVVPAITTARDRDEHGKCIAVLDKGFVYVGLVSTDDKYVYISAAQNIRKWTGGHGLSWYAKHGFDKDITLDESGDVKAPIAELKHLIICD